MGIVVPTLSPEGWVTDPRIKANKLMAYFLVADYSQSNDFQGQVRSLAYYIQKDAKDFFSLKDDLILALRELFGRHYDNIEVGVNILTSENTPTISASRFNIDISIIVTDKGTRHSLGRLLEVVDTKFTILKEL